MSEQRVRLKSGYVWTVGTCKNFKPYDYFECFRKTTVTWENHTSFVSHIVQSSSAVCLGVMRLYLCWGKNINFVAVTRKAAVFYRSILWKFPIQCWRGEFSSSREDGNHNQRSVVLRNSLVTWGARWNKEGWGGTFESTSLTNSYYILWICDL